LTAKNNRHLKFNRNLIQVFARIADQVAVAFIFDETAVENGIRTTLSYILQIFN
jgi:hypothetical protein